MTEIPKRILVLYVDRDDDLGVKAGIKTPLMGREANFKAASVFALKAPEDSDVNAMFAAIQLYDSLKEQGLLECEIATITGSPRGGLEADLKIRKELEEVLKVFNAESVILVSDGVDDEQAIPVVQSRVPVLSVRRVIVQQSKSVEETYILLVRYLKRIMEDPHYRKVFLGFPGILMLALSIMSILNLLQYASVAITILLGAMLSMKGFSLDERLMHCYKRFEHWWSTAPLLFFTYSVSLITLMVGLYISIVSCLEYLPKGVSQIASILILAPSVTSPLHSVDAFLASGIITLVGKALNLWISEEKGLWRYIVGCVFLALSRQIFVELGLILLRQGSLLLLLYWIVLTVIISASLTITFILRAKGNSLK